VRFAALIVLIAGAAVAQDDRRVVSPDGQLEFRLFVNGQPNSNLSRVAYQLRYKGKLLVDTSYLGIDIYTWEPLLGENTGMISEKKSPNALRARFMQNGSLARLLDVEVRVANDGVAFRCTIGDSTGLERLQIADDTTEFDLPMEPNIPLTVPYITEQKGIGWVAVSEVPNPAFPRMNLALVDADRLEAGRKIIQARLTRRGSVPDIVWEGKTPFTLPWRLILIGPDKATVTRSLAERQATLSSQP
jgi:hypothetical protein